MTVVFKHSLLYNIPRQLFTPSQPVDLNHIEHIWAELSIIASENMLQMKILQKFIYKMLGTKLQKLEILKR